MNIIHRFKSSEKDRFIIHSDSFVDNVPVRLHSAAAALQQFCFRSLLVSFLSAGSFAPLTPRQRLDVLSIRLQKTEHIRQITTQVTELCLILTADLSAANEWTQH